MSWYSKAKDWMKWRGTFEADHLVGDGTGITNLSAGTEHDPIFIAASNALAYIPTGGETDPLFTATSNALSYIPVGGETDPLFTATSNALAYISTGTETEPVFLAASSAYLTSYTETDPKFIAASAALAYVDIASYADIVANTAHAADSSDPHGAALTQTNLVLGSGAITIDNDASGAAVIRNILVGVEATPGPANLYPQGTIYLKYTA